MVGVGPIDIPPSDDNKYNNLVIITYLENDKLFKKCKYYSLYKALSLNSKDVFTQKIVTKGTIYDLQKLAIKKMNNSNEKKLIPEYIINFQ